ncbi:MAG: GspH/FimT family pseudopilin [Chromatiales bacterium]
MRTRPVQAGFTIIELMITILVLAILLGLAVPNMRDFILRNRLTSQTNALVASLQFARSEAVKRGTMVAIAPLTPANWASGWQVWVDDDRDGLAEATDNNGVQDGAGEPILRMEAALQGLAMFAVTDTGGIAVNFIRYLPNGAPSAALNARFCSSELNTQNQSQIGVTVSGHTQTKKCDNASCSGATLCP